MAQATICDRCGMIYKAETDVRKRRYHVFDSERERSNYELTTWNGTRVGEILDLCDACTDELTAWVKQKKNA